MCIAMAYHARGKSMLIIKVCETHRRTKFTHHPWGDPKVGIEYQNIVDHPMLSRFYDIRKVECDICIVEKRRERLSKIQKAA